MIGDNRSNAINPVRRDPALFAADFPVGTIKSSNMKMKKMPKGSFVIRASNAEKSPLLDLNVR